jgi:hypothetical protein
MKEFSKMRCSTQIQNKEMRTFAIGIVQRCKGKWVVSKKCFPILGPVKDIHSQSFCFAVEVKKAGKPTP